MSIPNNENSEIGALKSERSRSLDPTQTLDGFDPNRRRVSSISSLGNWTGAVLVSEAQEEIKLNGKWYSTVIVLRLNSSVDRIKNVQFISSGKE